MEETPADLPFYSPLSRTNSEMSDISNGSVPSEAGQSTSSQLEQASEQSDRTPTEDDLKNDNWRYLKNFFVMTQTPQGKSRNCVYQCKNCLPKHKEVKASKTTYDALKNHISRYHKSREKEFRDLIKTSVNHNKRRRDDDGSVSSPASQQPSISNWRGIAWGKPGQPVSNKQMDDDLVDLFVDGMLPLMVSASKLASYTNTLFYM
jgi:hypothetical protein